MSGGEMAAEDVAEPQFVDVKTSVWWDIENCQVPRVCDVIAIARNINSALSRLGYRGQVSISAYGDTRGIPLEVQQSLSSTGIALNHVPAGVKDASDKKILVDMLLWAIDNPAPANYLLISGDRDFSYCLHQLRMRTYNILLAQPLKASPALVSAAKSVWFWSSLVTGGAPISKNVNSRFNQEAIQNCSSEPTNKADIPAVANPKLMSPLKVRNGDPKYKEKYVKKNLNQPIMVKAHSTQGRVTDNDQQSGNAQRRAPKKAPHEFFRPNVDAAISTNLSATNFFPVNPDPSPKESAGKQESKDPSNTVTKFTMHFNPVPKKLIKTNPSFHSMPPRTRTPPLSSLSPTSSLDIGKLSISDNPNDAQRPLNLAQQTGEVSKLNTVGNSNPESKSSLRTNPDIHTNVPPCQNPSNRPTPTPEFSLGSPLPTHANVPSNPGVYEAGGLPPLPSVYELELLGLVLDALDRLKKEKISPSEANIADCICFRDRKNRNTDVRKALSVAVERQMVTKHTLGGGLYVSKGQRIWNCINPEGGQPNQYPKATWEKIQQFLLSSDGQSAIVASSCKYEAAVNLKQLCLQDHPLGEVIQIINILAGPKSWIKPNQSGWKPVIITVNKAHEEASQEAAS